jgi:hypothetical protein
MRGTTRTILGAIAISVLTGTGVAAQEADQEAPAMVYATGSEVGQPADMVDGTVEDAPDGSRQLRGVRFSIPVEFTDPRLSGDLFVWSNGAEQETTDGFARLDTRTHRLVNDDGAWTGSGLRVVALGEEPEPLLNHGSMLLVGEGAYEGFIAFVLGEVTEEGPGYRAVILKTDMVPEPVAE